MNHPISTQRPCWFVGFHYEGCADQSAHFYQAGIWENGHPHKYQDRVNAMQPGDAIVLKTTYTRKHGLPFDNGGESVSVMALHAVGQINANQGDGRTVSVNWQPFAEPREWYFYTNRATVWQVYPQDWMPRALIQFALQQQPQAIDQFRNAPYWWERFGDQRDQPRRFQWTRFYEALAKRLLDFQDEQAALLTIMNDLCAQWDGETQAWQAVCPFSVMAWLNRSDKTAQRPQMAQQLATALGGINEAVPSTFTGFPVLTPRQAAAIPAHEAQWALCRTAIQFAEGVETVDDEQFMAAYQQAATQTPGTWEWGTALYWIKPWFYPSLDPQSRHYISQELALPLPPASPLSGADYLHLQQKLQAMLMAPQASVISFPELTYTALGHAAPASVQTNTNKETARPEAAPATLEPYDVNTLMAEGCFIAADELQRLLKRWRHKKNLILQGAPGTGKTWLAKRLAYALLGTRHDSAIHSVQFHPNVAYEDFVRGWRPNQDGTLSLEDGPMLKCINTAQEQPEQAQIVLIEEINRGQPAQILGEMLTLLEADKRHPQAALALSHPRDATERVFIPPNLYMIGTMNIADRSLALVDFALRRRFAFATLIPQLGARWRDWVSAQYHIDPAFLDSIATRLQQLNQQLSNDPTLGSAFQIGHSFVTPTQTVTEAEAWFRDIVETEILPLLDEYWFDAPEKVTQAQQLLLADAL